GLTGAPCDVRGVVAGELAEHRPGSVLHHSGAQAFLAGWRCRNAATSGQSGLVVLDVDRKACKWNFGVVGQPHTEKLHGEAPPARSGLPIEHRLRGENGIAVLEKRANESRLDQPVADGSAVEVRCKLGAQVRAEGHAQLLLGRSWLLSRHAIHAMAAL